MLSTLLGFVLLACHNAVYHYQSSQGNCKRRKIASHKRPMQTLPTIFENSVYPLTLDAFSREGEWSDHEEDRVSGDESGESLDLNFEAFPGEDLKFFEDNGELAADLFSLLE